MRGRGSSPLGLYELVWMLNGSPFKPTPEEARKLSREVAAAFLQDGIAKLHILTWPNHDVAPAVLPHSRLYDEASWHEGHQFVALVAITGSHGGR
jgi:hypothetical protein